MGDELKSPWLEMKKKLQWTPQKHEESQETITSNMGLSRRHSGTESAWQCRSCKRCGFNPCTRKIPSSRKWQPTPVILPVKFHGQRSLEGYSPWCCKESDTTEKLSMHAYPYVQIYANKMDNLEEMDKFLERYTLARLNPEKNRKHEQTNHKYWNKNCDLKTSNK